MSRQLQACKHCGGGTFNRVCHRCIKDGLNDTTGKRMQVGDMLKQLNIVVPSNDVEINAMASLLAQSWGARRR